MPEQTLFYVVFILQILLLSFYFPRRILMRIRYVMENYPESTYPRLYPKSENLFKRATNIFLWINVINFILGWAILLLVIKGVLLSEGRVHPMLPWGYFMLQMIGSQYLEFSGFKFAKLMKEADTRKIKSVELKRRKFFDYVPPMLFWAVIATYVGFVWFAFAIMDVGADVLGSTIGLCVVLLLGYAFFFAIILWIIYGKKVDPYQSQDDRIRTARVAIKAQCFTMIMTAVFLAFLVAHERYGLGAYLPVAMSLFLQLLVVMSMGYLLQNNKIDDNDFDVYKAE
ncbi:hypothetical protein [Marinicella rhabdoformis]|uniref:hypothetical protein n=1 Tax=Marinicella rhabdoformis TaxID=2580566 RepID=UPI0012AECED8|nr:hypothetical protein [Marinicella rhabdoformis]